MELVYQWCQSQCNCKRLCVSSFIHLLYSIGLRAMGDDDDGARARARCPDDEASERVH